MGGSAPKSETAATVRWSSRTTYVIAAIGAAVGLGNVWKFPYMAGTGGGGAFVLVYLIALAAIATPVFLSETLIGRLGRASPPAAMRNVTRGKSAAPVWPLIGYLGLLATVLVLSFYGVVAGWTLAFGLKSASGAFGGMDGGAAVAHFGDFRGSALRLMGWQALFMLVVFLIVRRGLLRGLEKVNDFAVPALFFLLVLLLGYAVVEGAFAAGAEFLFAPDWSKLTPAVVLSAVGQAFFTLGVGAGGIMTYGAYIGEDVNIARATMVVVVADTAVAIIAGLVVFPIVFAAGLDPAEGPGLAFITLPIAFGNIPGGAIAGTAFFTLLAFGAITSAISILEPTVLWLSERGWSRTAATGAMCALIWLVGLLTVFSFNIWSDVHPLGFTERFAEATAFNLIDFGVNDIILPLSGAAYCIVVGWLISAEATRRALGLADGAAFAAWRFAARFVAPLAVAVLFVANLA